MLYSKLKTIELLKKNVRNEIRVSFKESTAPVDVCDGRIGGRPAVPKDFVWPVFNDGYETRPLSFLAQFNLEKVAPFDKEGLLPQTGVLSFFYELEAMTWGESPEDEGSAKVYYFPDASTLELADYPDELEEHYRVPEFEITLKDNVSLLDWEEVDQSQITYDGDVENYVLDDDLDNDDCDILDEEDYYFTENFEKCRKKLGYEVGDKPRTKLLGLPHIIQDTMMDDEWTLLFQIDSFESPEMDLCFGDGGHVYFWIKKEDLKNRLFDNVQHILQCY